MSRIAAAAAVWITFGLALGCQNADKAAAAAPGTEYHEVERDGRLYVLGSTDALNQFKSTGKLAYVVTLIGAGPNNETVVIEAGKDDTVLQDRLKAEYIARQAGKK